MSILNSQAPDVPELVHQGIFQLSRLSVDCYVKTVKNYSLSLNQTNFMKVQSVQQDHCGSRNYFMKVSLILYDFRFLKLQNKGPLTVKIPFLAPTP